jgi:hypothetical protein
MTVMSVNFAKESFVEDRSGVLVLRKKKMGWYIDCWQGVVIWTEVLGK